MEPPGTATSVTMAAATSGMWSARDAVLFLINEGRGGVSPVMAAPQKKKKQRGGKGRNQEMKAF